MMTMPTISNQNGAFPLLRKTELRRLLTEKQLQAIASALAPEQQALIFEVYRAYAARAGAKAKKDATAEANEPMQEKQGTEAEPSTDKKE